MIATRTRRLAFRMIDLLAVIVLVIIVIGLLLPASQRPITSYARGQCINNLKQVGLATHQYALAYQNALPPLTSDVAKIKYGPYNGGIFVTLLPFLEQEVLWNNGACVLPRCTWAAPVPPNSILPFSVIPNATSSRPLYNVPMKFYYCPADATVVNQNSGNQNATNASTPPYYFQWAASSYAANYQVFGVVNNFASPMNGSNAAVPQYNIGNIPDGNSNTVFYGEVFAACTNTAGSLWAYPGIANYSGTCYGSAVFPALDTVKTSPTHGGYNPAGASGLGDTVDNTTSFLWMPVFANSHPTYGFPREAFALTEATPDPGLTYWDLPPQTGVTQAQCDKARLQSFHTAAVVVGMGDGSVRTVNGITSQATWHAAILPDDGELLGSDW
jgi:type II secretory pathway pseudopilin PulG